MDDNEISKLMMANMRVVGRYVGFLNRGLPASKRTKLVLPRHVTRELGKMGLGGDIQALQRLWRGTDRQAREHFRRSSQLRDVFRSVFPQAETKLTGRTVEALLETIFYAKVLSERVREIPSVKEPREADRLKLILMEIQEVALRGLQKHVRSLQHDIPELTNRLARPPRKAKKRSTGRAKPSPT